MRETGEKIAALTCYDATFAGLMDTVGVDVVLIGDSLGNVVQGRDTTLAVTLTDIEYHTACVSRGSGSALIVADLPFGHLGSTQQAYDAAVRLMRAGAHMVKVEGGEWTREVVHVLTERSIPVCGHIGLTPQSVHAFGGFKVQGKSDAAAEKLEKDALAFQDAGATVVVIEAVPASLGATITKRLSVPTIGIGAGPGCSGQVLVMHDMLGATRGRRPRFVRDFMAAGSTLKDAFEAYVNAVKQGEFPADQHTF
ncbi:3-methyl-2-oxobutanoate hydroxymethyltransferase [Burkholderia multivorans]|nr:3-methyl-2-oxobutanoate hydroxymethyltransferase [Burkholderia multivorans]